MSREYSSTRKLTNEFVLSKIQKSLPANNYSFNKTVYTNSRTLMTVTCLTHGDFQKTPSALLKGLGCNVCDKHKNPNRQLTLEEYKIYANEIHDFKYDYSMVDSTQGIVTIGCHEHGKFTTRASAHISPSQLYSCKKCNTKRSKGEQKIANFLKDRNIKYIEEWTMPNQRSIDNKQPLRYDFYLPDHNIIIEFDGPHHFKPTRYGGQSDESAIKQFKLTRLYDGIKTGNAVLSNIDVIRISYLKMNDLYSILNETLINITSNNDKIRIYE